MEGEIKTQVNKLKRDTFFSLLDLAGRVFILVKHSDDVVIGRRGFTAEEKEHGIILVLNSGMHFVWDDFGIAATLVLGNVRHKCVIPADAVAAVYSPELGVQFAVSLAPPGSNDSDTEASQPADNVIKVDFKGKRKKTK
jgi:hypothetical protein